MSDRLDEARRALDDERQRRWTQYHRDRQPDLFTVEAWEEPASASETWRADALEPLRQLDLDMTRPNPEEREREMTTTNHVRLECTNFLTRRCCALCSGSIEKDAVLAVGGGDGSPTFYVCEGCLNVGPAGIQHRMREHADQLEAQARELREAAEESWVLPSHSEWSAANDSADRLFENPSEPHDWCQRPSCRSGALE